MRVNIVKMLCFRIGRRTQIAAQFTTPHPTTHLQNGRKLEIRPKFYKLLEMERRIGAISRGLIDRGGGHVGRNSRQMEIAESCSSSGRSLACLNHRRLLPRPEVDRSLSWGHRCHRER